MLLKKSYEKKNEKNRSLKFRSMHIFLTYTPRNLWHAYVPASLKGLNHLVIVGFESTVVKPSLVFTTKILHSVRF